MKLLVPLVLGGALLAHTGQRAADSVRKDVDAEVELMFIPSGQALSVASLGWRVHVADLLWLRSVLTFGTRWGEDPSPLWQEWLARMLLAVSELDPTWRTLYTYGGLMLKVTEAYEQSTEIFLRGAEQLPEDHFLLFSAGMNYYLYLDDPQRAYDLIKEAAERPGAPGWYKGAARAFVVKTSQRKVAIRFLKEELEQTDDPELRESLARHLANELHALRSEEIERARTAWEEGSGQVLEDLQMLVGAGLLESLPADPLGGRWVIDMDGIVRSSVAAKTEAAHALRYERGLLEFMDL